MEQEGEPMTYTIESDADNFDGDKITFNFGCGLYWIDNFNNALLNKTQMTVFLKKCLNFLEGKE